MNQNGWSSPVSVDSLKSWLCGWMAKELAIDQRQIDPGHTFLSYGMDSVRAMAMVGDLEVKFRLRFAPTLTWDYQTIDALAEHLADRLRALPAPAPSVVPQSKPEPSRAEIESLLAGIDLLEDHEVDRLLAQYLGESS
jgi:acyl carrier protein